MSDKVVIGMGFGDEGKGVTTEYLCSQYPKDTIVVRFSGGHQAGHKVIRNNVEHVFSSFGSGTLNECPTYWSKNCTIEPLSLWNEFEILTNKKVSPKLYVHPECPITTIFDVFAGRTQGSRELRHGTTGTGFFRTRKRHIVDGVHFTADALLQGSWENVIKRLIEVSKYYSISDKIDTNIFIDAILKVRTLLNKNIFISERIPNYQHRVFEGSQGLMLDEHIGYMPHCTPSDVTPKGVMDLGYNIDEVFLITRAYQTRHGSGPMTNEEHQMKLINNEKETNVSNRYQGNFRTSVLDLDQLIHAKTKGVDEIVPKNTKINLVVTCLDQLDEYRVSRNKGIMSSYFDPEKFSRFIYSYLKINGDLYLNSSPSAGSMKVLRSAV